jgi:uncharacterized protein DUF4241
MLTGYPPPARGRVHPGSGTAYVVLVTSGWGDGFYPTFIGYADDGDITALVTDFMVVPETGPQT